MSTTIWVLVIHAGISAWGTGTFSSGEYLSEESCYRALSAMRFNDQPVAESREKKSAFAYCKPKENGK